LARTGKVDLRIPWIVEREVVSGIEKHVDELTGQEVFLKGVRALAEMSSKPEEVRSLCDAFEILRPQICKEAGDRFRHWLDTSQAEILPLSHEHTVAVFDAYFAGSPPFDKPKNREHLPDAFIYYAVLELASKGNEIWFLAGDALLREALRKVQNVRVYSTFHHLFQDLQVPFDYAAQQQAVNRVSLEFEVLEQAAKVSLSSDLCGQVLRYGTSEKIALPVIRNVRQLQRLSLDKQSVILIDASTSLIAFEADVLLCVAERFIDVKDVLERLSESAVSLRGHLLIKLGNEEDGSQKIETVELDDFDVGDIRKTVAGEIVHSIAPKPEVAPQYAEEFTEITRSKEAGLIVVVGSTMRNRKLVAEHIVAAASRNHEVSLLNFSPIHEAQLPHVECSEDNEPFWNKAQGVEAAVLGFSGESTDWAIEAIHFLTGNDCFLVSTMPSANNRSAVVRYLAVLLDRENNLQHLLAIAWIQEVTPEKIVFAISRNSGWGDGTWHAILERDKWLAQVAARRAP
jgi:hypothetical protein